jgi:hypothetical protein
MMDKLREYDPVLGRFNGVDIMATKYANLSPYNYGFNNPVYWNDPTGADGEPPTWQQLMAAINALLEDGGGTWSRTAWDEGANGSGRGGGGCRGCSFFSTIANGGSYTYYSNGNGTGTLYVWTSTSTYSQARDEYQGQADLSIIDINMNTKKASFTSLDWGDGEIDGNDLMDKNSQLVSNLPFNSTGLALNVVGSGFSSSKSEWKYLLNNFTKSAVKTKVVAGKVLGAAGFVLTAYQFGSKLADPKQKLTTNDYLDFGVGASTFVAGLLVANPVGLAVIIGVGVGYGIYTIWRDNGN